ncbi:hypothetical protein F511_27033 [Dorcoceras hygrometricum]|uniref:Uncharacterized protein n=1 Tax=Dorcoceras hygrometricum TaxID=472368 RepID=A0A2Z7DCM2_9LAMI|nr:hypothetical protein F511_27033 [Dorcoceras hygrometricum]
MIRSHQDTYGRRAVRSDQSRLRCNTSVSLNIYEHREQIRIGNKVASGMRKATYTEFDVFVLGWDLVFGFVNAQLSNVKSHTARKCFIKSDKVQQSTLAISSFSMVVDCFTFL